jgi:hypothetical protein
MKRDNKGEPVTATEIACWVYCPEQWRLQYGVGLEPGNRQELLVGEGHHARTAIAERIAGGSITLGRALIVLVALGLLLLWLWR